MEISEKYPLLPRPLARQALLSASAKMKSFNDEELVASVENWRKVAWRRRKIRRSEKVAKNTLFHRGTSLILSIIYLYMVIYL